MVKRIRMKCRGKTVSRELHTGPRGGKFVMERKKGGGTKKKYLD